MAAAPDTTASPYRLPPEQTPSEGRAAYLPSFVAMGRDRGPDVVGDSQGEPTLRQVQVTYQTAS
jgi:hypothetical protein